MRVPKAGIKTVAILYSTNDFTGTQAAALKGFFEKDGKVKVVYYQGVPTTTSNYTVLINNIAALNPDAVLELGYVGNDIAFLRNLQDSGNQFRFVFSIYAGHGKGRDREECRRLGTDQHLQLRSAVEL